MPTAGWLCTIVEEEKVGNVLNPDRSKRSGVEHRKDKDEVVNLLYDRLERVDLVNISEVRTEINAK